MSQFAFCLAERMKGALGEDWAAAMEEAADSARVLIFAAIDKLLQEKYKQPVADKLLLFGSCVLQPLEEVISKPIDIDSAIYVALVLLKLGSEAGVPTLLSALKERRQPLGLIAGTLATAEIKNAAPLLESILSTWDFHCDPYTAATFVDALEHLGAINKDGRNRYWGKMPPCMNSAPRAN